MPFGLWSLFFTKSCSWPAFWSLLQTPCFTSPAIYAAEPSRRTSGKQGMGNIIPFSNSFLPRNAEGLLSSSQEKSKQFKILPEQKIHWGCAIPAKSRGRGIACMWEKLWEVSGSVSESGKRDRSGMHSREISECQQRHWAGFNDPTVEWGGKCCQLFERKIIWVYSQLCYRIPM